MTATSPAPTLAALLADGAWHSGPALATTLGITRAAISARVADLRLLGLDIYSVAGRGYRLKTPLELLDAAHIDAHLADSTRTRVDDLIVLERTDSTNAELARRADGMTRACLAEYQSAGRGRAQRPWASPFGANLYLSLARDVAAPRAPLGALSLAVGVCVADALTAFGAEQIALKWPNDLWAGDRKLGGILIEHKGEVGGSARLIIGLGLNLDMQALQGEGIDQPWTRLRDHLPVMPARNRLAAGMLDAVMRAVLDFETQGFAPFQARWARYDAARDRNVRVLEAQGERQGIARGIAADGALQVEIDGRVVALYSGDVSLRVAP
ncbi:biotin--[acetyl-CoA-carboxylase] ligase [Salinisphaera aquimarina]|uniref:Bifunctional ligase/repressor BirA n=1 Tax=Salinisphaera aquimarina TaxID=2094031 RepID=A0ABV7EQS5_9GAMM